MAFPAAPAVGDTFHEPWHDRTATVVAVRVLGDRGRLQRVTWTVTYGTETFGYSVVIPTQKEV